MDISNEEGLRAAMETLGGLRAPASEQALAAAEKEIGVEFPDLLRRMYRISDGLDHEDGLFFPLIAKEEDYGNGLLTQWRDYRENMCVEEDGGAEGYIGTDAYPIGSVFGDADTFVLRTNQPGVFEHYPDDGCLGKRCASVEAWLQSWLKGEEPGDEDE
ncbi:MAG TPA: hypothetical protein DEA08_33220 [Planctomycetes bacterium]|nr:hypothetical protein [Planctomycetota bacterium]